MRLFIRMLVVFCFFLPSSGFSQLENSFNQFASPGTSDMILGQVKIRHQNGILYVRVQGKPANFYVNTPGWECTQVAKENNQELSWMDQILIRFYPGFKEKKEKEAEFRREHPILENSCGFSFVPAVS